MNIRLDIDTMDDTLYDALLDAFIEAARAQGHDPSTLYFDEWVVSCRAFEIPTKEDET